MLHALTAIGFGDHRPTVGHILRRVGPALIMGSNVKVIRRELEAGNPACP